MSTARPPNLLVVVLDAVRAKSVDATFGARTVPTPQLDRLAARGSRFTQAIAPGNWTVPSHFSFLTGVYPWVHGMRTFRYGATQPPKIAPWLVARGYETAVFTEEIHLVAGYGMEDGYQVRGSPVPPSSDEGRTTSNRLFGHAEFLYSDRVLRAIGRVPRLAIPLSAYNFRSEAAFKRAVCNGAMTDAFASWIAQRSSDRPFHALLNFVDGHEPYPGIVPRSLWGASARGYVQVPRFYLLAVPELRELIPWELVEQEYLASVARADAKVGRLLEALDRAGEGGRTLVVVTSDHGQSFGEGGNVYHGCGATESVTRVPLVVGAPDGTDLPRTVERWTSLCEIPSWLKSAALGLEPFSADGLAPVPFPADPPGSSPIFSECGPASDPNRSLEAIGIDQRWNHRLIAAYRGPDKWVWDLETDDVWHWPVAADRDRERPTLLPPTERTEVLRSVYRAGDAAGVGVYRGESPKNVRAVLQDARMRSWGYD